MIEWVAIGIILSIFSGIILLSYLILFKPHRVKRFAYFLMAHWSWYRSWIFRQCMKKMRKINIKITASISGFIEPMKQMGEAFINLHKAMTKMEE